MDQLTNLVTRGTGVAAVARPRQTGWPSSAMVPSRGTRRARPDPFGTGAVAADPFDPDRVAGGVPERGRSVRKASTTLLLCAVLAVFWAVVIARAALTGSIGAAGSAALLFWAVCLVAWGVASARWALNGTYASPGFLRLVPALWWLALPALFTVCLLALPGFARALGAVVADEPRAFVAVQAVRIAAIGGVIKGVRRLLPPSFALPIGIPDIFFGISALVIALSWPVEGFSTQFLVIWNVIGVAVILPLAPVLGQMSLPGPIYVFKSQPDGRALLEYPMVLAPTLIVPLLITMNAMQAVVLWLGIPK